MKFGKVTRPILGIKFAPDQSVEQLGVSGVLVLDAPPDGPAGKAVIFLVLKNGLSVTIIPMLSKINLGIREGTGMHLSIGFGYYVKSFYALV